MEESMVFKIVDISSGAITLALAAILIYLKMPQDIRWKAMRRMLSLLSLCYICMGVSNLITGLTGVSEAENAEMGIAVLFGVILSGVVLHCYMSCICSTL